jgi:hypothetical protein
MSMTPSPFSSMSTSGESSLFMVIWSPSFKHPKKVHKYAKKYHLGTTKLTSLC